MKKIFLVLCAGAFVTFTACKQSAGSDPKTTLLSFFKALSRKDIETARKYATKESDGMLSMMAMGMQMAQNMKGDENTDFEKKFNEANMQIGEPRIDGDKALVAVMDKTKNQSADFTLLKQDGSWKVAFDQATLMQMAGDRMHNEGVDTHVNIDSISQVIKKMNPDSLKQIMQEGMKKMDSVRNAMKH